MIGDYKANCNIFLGRAKKINPVYQIKGDVVKINSLIDNIDVFKEVSMGTNEPKRVFTTKSNKGI